MLVQKGVANERVKPEKSKVETPKVHQMFGPGSGARASACVFLFELGPFGNLALRVISIRVGAIRHLLYELCMGQVPGPEPLRVY